MATDFSQLFGQAAQPTGLGPIATRDPFALAGPKAAMFKRKIVMQEAQEQGLEVDDGEAFFSFVGNRLHQLGDGEGAMATMQKFQEFQQQQIVNQQNQQQLGINQGNLRVNQGNLAEKLTKGIVRTLTPEEVIAEGYPPNSVVQRDERTGKDTVTRASKLRHPDEQAQHLESSRASADNISFGTGEKLALSKPTINFVQEKLQRAQALQGTLGSMKKVFKPKLLEWPTRLEEFIANIADKAGVSSPKQKALIKEMTALGTETYHMFNAYLNQMSGAAITVKEADRLKMSLPDFGEDWWKGDAPTKFFSKLEANEKVAQMAAARYHYLLHQGRFDELATATADKDAYAGPIPLEAMPTIIKNRATELADMGMSPQEAEAAMSIQFGKNWRAP